MKEAQKVRILNYLNTKGLVEQLKRYENELEKALTEQMTFTSTNHSYLATRGNDCQEVKRILAELTVATPNSDGSGKKLTVPDKENWLIRQREENKELNDAITKQRQVAFLLDDHSVKIEILKKRLEGTRAVLALRTAQINFLASD